MGVALSVVLIFLAGCQGPFTESIIDDARVLSKVVTSKSTGTARVKVDVGPGETSLLATVDIDAPYKVHVRSLTAPDDTVVFLSDDWTSSVHSKTNAGFIANTVSLNWPVLPSDVPLTEGKWVFEFGVVDDTLRYASQPFLLDVILKQDASFDQGALQVAVIYTEDLRSDASLTGAVDEAKELWRDLYGQAGIDLMFETFVYDGGPLAPPAFGEEGSYVDIAADTALRSVNVVLSETIEGYADILGISGDIPGPLVPTARSAVQISTLESAGADGQFDATEVRLLAETMAHETAHFLGLFHPVEREDWSEWDAVEDTDECQRETQCIDRLGGNLMFPFPVCGPTFCQPQSDLTADQGAVLNRYTGVF